MGVTIETQASTGLRAKVYFVVIVIAVASLWVSDCWGAERVWLEGANINGKAARMYFDSGAMGALLTSNAVERLGLKVIDPGTNGLGDTAVYTFKWNNSAAFKTDFGIMNEEMDCDGIVGWDFASGSVVRIDAVKGIITPLWHSPWFSGNWARFPIITNSGMLDIEMPQMDGTKGIFTIDTGSPMGLAISSRLWRQWRNAHPQAPTTARSFASGGGFFTREEALADRINIGALVLTNVPLMEVWSNDVEAEWGSRYGGIIGMAALDHLEVIADGIHNVAYLHVGKNPAPPYSYNRLGALFYGMPANPDENSAWVLPGGPAYEAGIRNGDVLVHLDGLPPIKWTTDKMEQFKLPADSVEQFVLPAGTKIRFTLHRNGTNFETVATLRNILQPNIEHK